jgi:hypothetical protein
VFRQSQDIALHLVAAGVKGRLYVGREQVEKSLTGFSAIVQSVLKLGPHIIRFLYCGG